MTNEDFIIENGTLKRYEGADGDVVIPDSVTSIGDCVFWGCRELNSIIITDGVTSIGERAFSDCSGLTSITIQNSVKSIGYSAFAWCGRLTSINYEGTQSQWDAIDKGEFWDVETGNYVIHCADGDINKDEDDEPY